MTQHNHSERVDGCFRCDLSADEVRQPCTNPSHFAAPHHHGERGQAVQHRIEGCPWVCGKPVYSKEETQ